MIGSCLCGGVKFEIKSLIGPFELCHCPKCRKVSGSAYMAAVGARPEDFTLLQGAELIKHYVHPVEKTPPAYTVAFCGRCSSPVPDPGMQDEFFEIPAGLIDGDSNILPDKHIFVECKANWDKIDDSLPQFTKEELAEYRKKQA